jgi:hypothetical protein
MNHSETQPSFAKGGVKFIFQLEGLCVLALSLLAYAKFGSDWGTFALLFFVPDIFMLGYLLNAKVGAIFYNTSHSYVMPLLVLGVGIYVNAPTVLAVGIIWTAHIGFDRMLGYGLKYSNGFRFTHLGMIGRPKKID